MTAFKEIRIRAGFKRLKDAAELLGVGSNTLSRWENGKREPNIAQIRQMAELYGVSMNELLRDVPPAS